ncbi:MAG: ATP-binding protein [Sphingomonadaceae bacterium]
MIGDIPSVLREIQAARSGQYDAAARLAKAAVRLLAPEYAPAVESVERLARHLGVRLTPEGIDLTELKAVITGEGESTPPVSDPDARPWWSFQSRLRGLRSGVVLILGPRGSGKSTLAVRLAEAWRRDHGYDVIAVNMYRDDLRPWIQWRSIEVFADAVGMLADALSQGQDPPREIRRKVVLIDEASLSLHPRGTQKGILAVERAIRQARHLNWLIVVIAHLGADLPVQMTWCDAVMIKEPSGGEAEADRQDNARYWQAAAAAYRELRRSGLRGLPIQGWVYVHAPELGYRGMMPYGVAGREDPYQAGKVRAVPGDTRCGDEDVE